MGVGVGVREGFRHSLKHVGSLWLANYAKNYNNHILKLHIAKSLDDDLLLPAVPVCEQHHQEDSLWLIVCQHVHIIATVPPNWSIKLNNIAKHKISTHFVWFQIRFYWRFKVLTHLLWAISNQFQCGDNSTR